VHSCSLVFLQIYFHMGRFVEALLCCMAAVIDGERADLVSNATLKSIDGHLFDSSESWMCGGHTITVTDAPFASGHGGDVPISKGAASSSFENEQAIVWKEAHGTCIECAATRWAKSIGATSMDCVATCEKGIALTVVTDSRGTHCPTVKALLKTAAVAKGPLKWVDLEKTVSIAKADIPNLKMTKAMDPESGHYTYKVMEIEGFEDAFVEKASKLGLDTGLHLVSINGLACDDNEGLGKLMSSPEGHLELKLQSANLEERVEEVIDLVEHVMHDFIKKYEPFLTQGVINTDQSAVNVLACDFTNRAGSLVFIDFGLDGLRIAKDGHIPPEIQSDVYGSMVGMLFCNPKLDYPPQICKAAKKVAATRVDSVVASLSGTAQAAAREGLHAFATTPTYGDIMCMFNLADGLRSANGASVLASDLLSFEALSECV